MCRTSNCILRCSKLRGSVAGTRQRRHGMPHTADIPVAVAHRIAQSSALQASPPEATTMTTPPDSYWKTLNVREIDISHIRLGAYGCCDGQRDLPDDQSRSEE